MRKFLISLILLSLFVPLFAKSDKSIDITGKMENGILLFEFEQPVRKIVLGNKVDDGYARLFTFYTVKDGEPVELESFRISNDTTNTVYLPSEVKILGIEFFGLKEEGCGYSASVKYASEAVFNFKLNKLIIPGKFFEKKFRANTIIYTHKLIDTQHAYDNLDEYCSVNKSVQFRNPSKNLIVGSFSRKGYFVDYKIRIKNEYLIIEFELYGKVQHEWVDSKKTKELAEKYFDNESYYIILKAEQSE